MVSQPNQYSNFPPVPVYIEREVERVRNTSATVGTTTSIVLQPDRRRRGATLMNDSDTVIYLSLGPTAVLNNGIRLNASGGSYEITAFNLYTGEISAISSAATKNLCITEHY